jgi:hypothetical protein
VQGKAPGAGLYQNKELRARMNLGKLAPKGCYISKKTPQFPFFLNSVIPNGYSPGYHEKIKETKDGWAF